MALTKAQMVKVNSKINGFSRKKSSEIIETLLELIKKTLASGEDVLISNFGKFCVIEKKERKGRNPATGEDLVLRPRRVVTFRCSGTLRKKINRISHILHYTRCQQESSLTSLPQSSTKSPEGSGSPVSVGGGGLPVSVGVGSEV